MDLLKQAQNEAANNPSNAIILLDSIKSPEKMGKGNYMQYVVTRVQARYNNDEDITGDTLVFEAQKYYNDISNFDKAAVANFYAGTVYRSQHVPEKALNSFLLATAYSRKAKNTMLAAKSLHFLGNIYLEQGITDSSIVHLHDALNLYNNESETGIRRLQVMSALGRSYDLANKLDSAYYFFNKSLDLANETDNAEHKAIQAYNLGYITMRMKQYDKSTVYLSKALEQTANTKDSLKIYLNLSLLYNEKSKPDSAKYYTDLIKNQVSAIKDNYLLESIYGSLSDYNSQIGDVSQALYYKGLQMEANQKILEERSTEKLFNAENKYQLQIQEQEHKAERKFFVLLQVTVFILMLLAIMFCRKRKYKKLKKLEEKVHSLTQDRLFEHSIASKSYLENVYEHFIIGWSDIETKVNQILLTGREEIDIEIYIEIKAMVDALKKQTNEQLLIVAKDYLSSDLYLGKKLSGALTDTDLIILMLCHLQYSEEAIAFIIDSKGNTFNLTDIKWNIERKLHQAGMNEFNIKALLYPE
ncbi:hypothetical protein CLV62_104142 [Dysgonomonas alginatilytica]|uniref:Uncharacterized protein n=1 Tax=Dysgonomonas alginatilytica TaxID=1605892 RepID=A0A2V3PTM4_9BACT|nr:hypothetical protein CLV62_104142 [Dysgonomonas alginatilytica]